MNFEDRILDHLTKILYPPVSKKYLGVAIKAILLAREGKYEENIQMPGGQNIKIKSVISWLLLHNFIDPAPINGYLEAAVVQNRFQKKHKIRMILSKLFKSLFLLILTLNLDG